MDTPNLIATKEEERRFEATAVHDVGVVADSTSLTGIPNPAFTMTGESVPNSCGSPAEHPVISHSSDKTIAATKTVRRKTCMLPVLCLILLVAILGAGIATVAYWHLTDVTNGPISISSACNSSSCGNSDSGWGPWSDTTCTKPCGGGLFLSMRACDYPFNGGGPCTRKDGTTGLTEQLSVPCNTSPCPDAASRIYLRSASGGASACNAMQAGLEKLARGVDVVTVDMLPLDTKKSQGFKGRLIAYTCTQNKKRTNPVTKVEYTIPDQVEISSVPAGALNSHTELHESASSVKKSHAANLGLRFLYGLIGIGGSAGHMKNRITRQSENIADTTVFHSSFQAHLHPGSSLQLTHHAEKAILDLPNRYHTDPAKFAKFIRYYGTHYFENGQFGGLWRNYMEIKTHVLSQMTETEVKVQIESSVAKKLKDMGFPAEIPLPRVEKFGWSSGYGDSRVTIDGRFMRNVKQGIKYYGGNVNIFSSDDAKAWQRWEDSVPANPWMFSGRLEPISSLIQDPHKKQAMEIAVHEHFQRAYLKDLQDQCKYLLQRILDYEAVRKRVATRLAQIDRLRAVPIGRLLRFKKQLRDLKNTLYIPDWFTDGTRLCFRWKSDNPSNPHECGYGSKAKPVEELLCAQVNTMTKYYRDDTNDGSGGCEMQWKIQSDMLWPATNWFAETQICYHWKPEKVKEQCANGAAPEQRCAKLDNFTAVYRDDTHSVAGGCLLHWRLEISARAPLWMQTVQLCFEWFADKDWGEWECGRPGLPRKMCAGNGQWTRFYRDDTTWRWGGCKMRWGIMLP